MGENNALELVSKETQSAIITELAKKMELLELANADLKKQMELKNKQIEIVFTQGLDIRKIHNIDEIEQYLSYQAGYLQNLLEQNEAEYLKSIFTKHNALIDIKVQAMKDKQIDVNGDTVASKLKEAVEFFRNHPTVDTFTADSTKEYAETVTKLSNALELLWAWKGASADLSNFNEAVTHGIMQYAIKKIALENKMSIEKTQAIAIDPEKELEARKAMYIEEEAKKKVEVEKEDKLAKLEASVTTLTDLVQKLSASMQPAETSLEEQVPDIEDAPVEPVIKKKR